uniref:G protein-coupled receptor n=1 Tax=Haemonchus contortus TaxID=6289 RepID=A0A7I5E8F4_HAECO
MPRFIESRTWKYSIVTAESSFPFLNTFDKNRAALYSITAVNGLDRGISGGTIYNWVQGQVVSEEVVDLPVEAFKCKMAFIDFDPVFINCYYAIFVTVAVGTNVLLLYLINYRTPDIVRNMKVMLMNISTAQIVLALLSWFSQGRVVPDTHSTTFIPAGPSRMLSPVAYLVICDSIYALTAYVELMIVHTMFCRYSMLQTKPMSSAKLLLSFVMMAIWPLVIVIFVNFGFRQYDGVMENVIRMDSHFNQERYNEFGGFKLANALHNIRTAIAAVVTVASSIAILFLRYFILKTLNIKNQQLSGRTAQSSEMFLKALTVQVMVPIFCFVPGILLVLLPTIFGSEIVLVEYTPYILGTLPCVVDPLIAIFFVPPYRAWVLRKCCECSIFKKAKTQNSTHCSSQGRVFTVTVNPSKQTSRSQNLELT